MTTSRRASDFMVGATVLVVTIKDGKPARLPPDIAKLFNPASA